MDYPWLAPGKDPSHWTGLDPSFQSQLDAFLSAAPGQGISVYSGYRSVKRQAELWQGALKKYGSPAAARKWVAPPGSSSHNHGLAADLTYGGPGLEKWAHENAAKYGLRFRMSNEDWHIEPMDARQRIAGQSASPRTLPQMDPLAAAVQPGQMSANPIASLKANNDQLGSQALPGLPGPGASPEESAFNSNQMMADIMSGVSPFRRMIYGGLLKLLA